MVHRTAPLFPSLGPAANDRRAAETPNVGIQAAQGRRVSAGGSRIDGCGACSTNFGGSSGGEAEEKPLLFPVVRQVLAEELIAESVTQGGIQKTHIKIERRERVGDFGPEGENRLPIERQRFSVMSFWRGLPNSCALAKAPESG